MTTSKPKLHWCWPEALNEAPELGDRLAQRFDLIVSTALPVLGDHVQFLVPRLDHEVNAAFIESQPSLRIIATPSTGTDHIDVDAASRANISIVSLKHELEFLDSVQSTAEQAWLLILACARRFREAVAQPLAGGWSAMDVRGSELYGKTIGIVGCGRLGSMVVRFAQAFRMRVLVTDVRCIRLANVEQVDLPILLAQADIVSIHVHLTDRTCGLIGATQLAFMKRGAVLVNTSRGAVIDETALLAAIQSGHLGAAGLDVLCGESRIGRDSHPLVEASKTNPRLVITPHVGGCTVEAQAKAFNHFAGLLIKTTHALNVTGVAI